MSMSERQANKGRNGSINWSIPVISLVVLCNIIACIFFTNETIAVSVVLLTDSVVLIWIAIHMRRMNKRAAHSKDYLNDMTHELKTPISNVGLICDMLKDDSVHFDGEQTKHYLEVIRYENKRLNLLVNQMLQAARYENKGISLEISETNVNEVLTGVANTYRITVEKNNGHIYLETDRENTCIMADRLHFTNIVSNLIDNAVKYCDKEPKIVISAFKDSNGYIVEVKDNGLGIEEKEQEKIFRKYYRVKSSNKIKNLTSYGIGLSYVKEVMKMHGGEVKLKSKPGEGSIFSLVFPLDKICKA